MTNTAKRGQLAPVTERRFSVVAGSPAPASGLPKKSGAVRQKRYRRRQARGLAVLSIEADVRGLAELLEVEGWLEARDAESFPAIQAAATRMFAEIIDAFLRGQN